MPQPPAPTARSFSRSSKRSEPAAATPGEPVAVGEIVAPHALGGILRFRPYQAPAPSLVPGRTVLVDTAAGRREMLVTSAAPHGRGLILLGLDGVHDRTAAEALVRARILVPAEALPPPGDGEFYWHEVIGFDVETTAGVRLGAIADVFSTGLNDVWTVRDGGREYLIPVIADVVRTLDRDRRRAVIEPMPGLLD